VVHALRYTSQKLGQTLTAYLYQPPGAPFARYYTADGQELEERLRDSPIANYEQVTSFLRDGRHHHGVDFKCPVGTPVVAPFEAELVRKNWNWHGNGNCLELVDAATGRHAKFLHLSVLPASLAPGQHFKKGQPLALSGNTGHTTAPHLHYQLESSDGAILDPFKVHKTYRAKLDDAQLDAFKKAASTLDQSLSRE
jgi:murein DD-endopeptidase